MSVKSRLRDNGLVLANAALFVLFLLGLWLTGQQAYNADQRAHHEPAVSLIGYLRTPDFGEALFENWESEFLQMAMYVVLAAYLIQKGSAESKSPDGDEHDEDPRKHQGDAAAPWPVRRGGVVVRVYENSLAILLGALFLASIALHAVTGAAAYSAEQRTHGEPAVSVWDYVTTSQFWFESFQNWQSEFLAVAVVVLASVWLRQRGSSQSKPVHAPHAHTGG